MSNDEPDATVVDNDGILVDTDEDINVCCYEEYYNWLTRARQWLYALTAWLALGCVMARSLTTADIDERVTIETDTDANPGVCCWQARIFVYQCIYDVETNCCIHSGRLRISPQSRNDCNRCMFLNMVPLKVYIIALILLATVMMTLGYTHVFDTPAEVPSSHQEKREWNNAAVLQASAAASSSPPPPKQTECCFTLSMQYNFDNSELLVDQAVPGDHWAERSGVQIHYTGNAQRLLDINVYGLAIDDTDDTRLLLDCRWPCCLHTLSIADLTPHDDSSTVSARVYGSSDTHSSSLVRTHQLRGHTMFAHVHQFTEPVCDTEQSGIELRFFSDAPINVSEFHLCFYAPYDTIAPDFDTGYCEPYEPI